MSRHVTFRHNELISSVRVSIRWKTKMFKAKSIGIQIFLKPLTETALSWNRCPELLKDPSTRGPKLRPFSRWVSSTRAFFCIILRICLHCHFQNHLFVSFRPWIRTFLKPHFFLYLLIGMDALFKCFGVHFKNNVWIHWFRVEGRPIRLNKYGFPKYPHSCGCSLIFWYWRKTDKYK